ncbi:hypothetical protein DSL72_007196 [Monilinia vaccinii-corymbosi]|uniref:Uncharacterized protein n=1 Tax=Monilinia vaccinii-corymbosi TaxID=61207 RepID=A0A8A3PL03_9HELO|nr:hypothetical protein DSL72_007196 [Monilinia vaccinii-corymbosi]
MAPAPLLQFDMESGCTSVARGAGMPNIDRHSTFVADITHLCHLFLLFVLVRLLTPIEAVISAFTPNERESPARVYPVFQSLLQLKKVLS